MVMRDDDALASRIVERRDCRSRAQVPVNAHGDSNPPQNGAKRSKPSFIETPYPSP
jgi:hypothetical protein